MFFKQLLFCLIIILSNCSVPHDPENSWEEAQKDVLKVGVVHNPPFAISEQKPVRGKEVKMIEEFAREHDLSIEYIKGSESDLIKKIKHYKLHLLIGGFKKSTTWKKHAGVSKPYDSEKHVILLPKGENKLLFNLESFIEKIKKK